MKDNKISKKTYSNIIMPVDVENNILNNTIKKNDIKKYNCLKKCLAMIIILLCFSSTIVLANIIKSYFLSESPTAKNLSLTAKKHIRDNSMLQCKGFLEISEVEKELDVLFLLHSEGVTNKLEQCEIIYDKNDNIRRIFLGTSEFYNFENVIDEKNKREKNIELEMFLMTQYATEEDEKIFEKAISLSGGEDVEKMFSRNFISDLNLEVFVVKFNDDGYYPITFCFFVFDNVLYNFKGKNVSENEILDVISNLRLY